MTEVVKKAVMSMKKMSVIIWCVTAIVVIVWLAFFYGQPSGDSTAVTVPSAVVITAMTLVAALGGADTLRNKALDKAGLS
jgi:predicted transglutaminase-like protease